MTCILCKCHHHEYSSLSAGNSKICWIIIMIIPQRSCEPPFLGYQWDGPCENKITQPRYQKPMEESANTIIFRNMQQNIIVPWEPKLVIIFTFDPFGTETTYFCILFLYQMSHKQWRSQGLPARATRPPGRPKWGRKWVKLRKNKKNWSKFDEKWGKWNSCPPGRDCEAGYSAGHKKEYTKQVLALRGRYN